MGRKEFSWDGIYNFFRKWPWRWRKLIRGEYKIENRDKRKIKREGRAVDKAGRAAGKEVRREEKLKQKEVDSDAE